MPELAADDRDLVASLMSGDRAAFARLCRKHSAAMVRMVSGIVHSRATAEEVAQETWIAVLTNIGGFEGRSSLAGWIFTILINKANSRARRDGRMVLFDGRGEDDTLAAAFDGRGRWKDVREIRAYPGSSHARREILHVRHHSLFAPRDFDLSPHFQIVKPHIADGFDHHLLEWDDRDDGHARPGDPHAGGKAESGADGAAEEPAPRGGCITARLRTAPAPARRRRRHRRVHG